MCIIASVARRAQRPRKQVRRIWNNKTISLGAVAWLVVAVLLGGFGLWHRDLAFKIGDEPHTLTAAVLAANGPILQLWEEGTWLSPWQIDLSTVPNDWVLRELIKRAGPPRLLVDNGWRDPAGG
jgi:hypothetical protein